MRKLRNSKMLEPFYSRTSPLKDALLDGAYDNKDDFKFFKRKGIDPRGIKVRKNASRRGLSERAFAVREFQKLGYEKWKKKHDYGKRWAVEKGFFLGSKKVFW